MKKWIVYILSLTALVVSLCACGTAEKPAATNAPRPSGTPMTATPDMNEFTAPFRLRTVGELLPRLSTLTCPKAGGISLLHLSWGHPRRALPVILALWSPDFPHAQAFALCPRLLGFLAQVFYLFKARLSTAIGVEFLPESEYNI